MQPLTRVSNTGRRIGAAAFFLVALMMTPARAAEPCPIDDAAAAKAGGMAKAVTASMTSTFSCEGAYRILELCQLGSSADNALSDIVLSKCEPRFAAKAVASTRDAYEKARGKCRKVAEKKDGGTLAQSQAAVCIARTSRDFARKYGTKG